MKTSISKTLFEMEACRSQLKYILRLLKKDQSKKRKERHSVCAKLWMI